MKGISDGIWYATVQFYSRSIMRRGAYLRFLSGYWQECKSEIDYHHALYNPIGMKLIPLIFILLSFAAHAEPTVPEPLQGDYSFSGLEAESKRIAEIVKDNNSVGKARVKALRADGFICIRRNTEQSLCSKNIVKPELPANIAAMFAEKFSTFHLLFPACSSQPELIINTSTQVEWLLECPANLGAAKIELYKHINYHNGAPSTVSFPVNDAQPLPYARIMGVENLAVITTASLRENKQTISYLVSVIFKKTAE